MDRISLFMVLLSEREANRWQEEIDRAIEGIKALRKRTGKITLNRLLSARH